MLSPLVGVALPQGFLHPVQHIIIERQSIQHGSELTFENFLPCVGLWAFSSVAGAMIVHMAPLFAAKVQQMGVTTRLHAKSRYRRRREIGDYQAGGATVEGEG
jgi:hypothetical protein